LEFGIFCAVKVGFGDPQYDPEVIFDEFKRALDQVENRVDCVLFLVRKGRFTQVGNFYNLKKKAENKTSDLIKFFPINVSR